MIGNNYLKLQGLNVHAKEFNPSENLIDKMEDIQEYTIEEKHEESKYINYLFEKAPSPRITNFTYKFYISKNFKNNTNSKHAWIFENEYKIEKELNDLLRQKNKNKKRKYNDLVGLKEEENKNIKKAKL